MNINEMKVGRELDELVAEKVMGWRWVSDSYRGGVFRVWYAPEGDRHFTDRVEGSEILNYSFDIAAAWEVVEWLQVNLPPNKGGNGHDWLFVDAPNRFDGQLWCVGWKYEFDYEGELIHTCAIGETAPLAICRAALKAVGV